MTAISSEKNYYPALDGLRGIAILLVVCFHNFGFINYFYFGWLGVDLFFVLSGFLITEILLNTVEKPNYLRNFYVRRILRIFPLYYSVLIISVFLLPLIPSLSDNLKYYVDNQFWLWTYLQNWLYIFKEPEKTNFLVHFWSLAVEEQFYLFWPLLILWIRNPKTLFIIVSSVLVAVLLLRIYLWMHHVQLLNYFNPYTFTRIDGLCIGVLLAIIKFKRVDLNKSNTLVVLVLALLNFLFFFINKANSFSFPYIPFFGYTSFAIVFALAIHEAIRENNTVLNIVLTFPLLRFLGKISYGFYVFHWPIYLGLFPKLSSLLNTSFNIEMQRSQIVSALIATIVGLIVSVISYFSFEQKFLKLKNRYSTA